MKAVRVGDRVGSYRLREEENKQFEEYYRVQLAPLLSEAEWDGFVNCLCTPLPVTFRISGFAAAPQAAAVAVRDHLEAVLLLPLADLPTPPSPLPWYPGRLAWKLDTTRAELRGKGCDGDADRGNALRQLHLFLMEGTESGSIHRQEAASMVPPLLLDVRPGMSVLDMCAAFARGSCSAAAC